MKFTILGIEINNYRRQKPNVQSAIVALDVKITDFIEKLDNRKYASSRYAVMEYGEIVGQLKFMYLGGIITRVEYKRILIQLVGDDNTNLQEVNEIEKRD